MIIDNAWALGQWEQDDGVLSTWKRAIESSRIPARQRLDIDNVFGLLSPTSLVLLSYGLDVDHQTLTQLQATKSKLLIYIPAGSREISPDAAVHLCSQGVLGCFTERRDLPGSLGRRLDNLLGKRRMFQKINLTLPNRGASLGRRIDNLLVKLSLHDRAAPPCAFLASPYAPAIDSEFTNAAKAALLARGISVKDPRDVHIGGTIEEKVDALIQESDFMVANLRLTELGFNPNVWMEIGYARGLGKQVVPFCFAGDAEPVASDLKGVDYLKYHDSLDLAMKLYWGLDWMGHP